MKLTIKILLASLTLGSSGFAAPTLLLETTITEHRAARDKIVLAAPRVVIESGRQAVVEVNKLEYAVTPTLLDNGTVEIRATLTDRTGGEVKRLAAPRIKTQLDHIAEIQVGQFAFTTKTSVVKQP